MSEDYELRQRFNKELWPLNKTGNEESTFSTLQAVHKQVYSAKKEVVTIDLIISKYKDYLAYWNSKFGKTEERFIGKDNKKKEIALFIASQSYNEEYTIEETPRDMYLFGSYDRKFLKKRTTEFLNRFKTKKDEPAKQQETVPEKSAETEPF